MKLVRVTRGKKEINAGKHDMYDIYDTIRKPMPRPGGAFKDKNTEYNEDLDSPSIADLEREALVSCELRGHEMGDWDRSRRGSANISTCECVKCQKYVQVIDLPQPNEIDIGGTAVALHCSN